MCIFLFFIFAQIDRNIELFQPISPNEFLAIDSKTVFILDSDSNMLFRVSSTGEVLRLGGRGQGPGEWNSPSRIFKGSESVFVWDSAEDKVSQFNFQGEFLKDMKLPCRGGVLRKVKSGWLIGTWYGGFTDDKNLESTVLWFDGEFQEKKIMTTTKGKGFGGTFLTAQDGKSIYKPIQPVPLLEVSPDGEIAYLVDAEQFKVRRFDTLKLEELSAFKRKMPTIEFNPTWADIRLNEVKKMFPTRTYRAIYPQTFPIVRHLTVAPNGNLVFLLWTFEPHTTEKTLVLNSHGQVEGSDMSYKDWRRYLDSHGERCWVGIFENDLASFKAVESAHWQDTIQKSPYHFERDPWRPIR